jgi:hypothetical protein
MAATHDYDTRPMLGRDLTSAHVLVGESGGLSAVYDCNPSSLVFGLVVVTTEHGQLYLDPDALYEVLDADPLPTPTDAAAGRIRASLRIDDVDLCRLDVDFDAAPWFGVATDEQVQTLANCGWGGDYPADDVAGWMRRANREVDALFVLIEARGAGYECHVDADDAIAWLGAHRPHLQRPAQPPEE